MKMKRAPIVVNPTSSFNTPPPECVFDYHNNNLVSDLERFLNDPVSQLYTDWEMLNKIAAIVDKRKVPSPEMTDCATGLCYRVRSNSLFEQAMKKAQHNAGK